MKKILKEEWQKRAKEHLERVGPIADAFLERRSTHKKHPVHDFLFRYYPFSPAKLKEWVPSFEEELDVEGVIVPSYFREHWFEITDQTLRCHLKRLPESTKSLAVFIEELSLNILKRPPRFGCFGLHEWAMVYKLSQEELRHKDYKLRLSSEELNAFVEAQNLCCTHYDAYRFFTPGAVSLNFAKPTLATRPQYEQGGCLHANMDLYKWANKLWPWIGSDFIGKAFFLALEGREIDMRASPYDLQSEGYTPIRIETEEGRKEYQKLQQDYAQKTTVLRQELAAFCSRLRLL